MEFTESVSRVKSNALKAITFAGLLAGAADLTAACINSGLSGVSPVLVFQAIASGLLGAESYKGGAATAVLGGFLHFVIAFGASVVYFAVSRKIKFLIVQPLAAGAVYGSMVHLFMQFIVLPLSLFPGKNRFTASQFAIGLLIHIFCVGLPIAFVVARYSKSENDSLV